MAASFDYAQARLLARIAYLHQYNAVLGEMRKALPLLDRTKEKGWRLVATDLNYQDRDAATYGRKARLALQALAQNHPAYAEIAAAEAKEVEKGLKWEAWLR